MVLSLKKAKDNLINAQKEAEEAYKKVVNAREVYNKLLNKSVGTVKKRVVPKKRSKSTLPKKSVTKNKKKASTKKSTTKTKGKKRSMRGGGGSDWLNTVNSRGNVAGPNDHWGVDGAKWFKQFEKSGDYISMSQLRRGGYQHEESAAQAPKIPNGLYADVSVYGQFGSGVDLGTQRT